MAYKPQCRICKLKIDKEKDPTDSWFMPSKNFYYHTKCYSSWKNNLGDVTRTDSDDSYFLALKDYLYKELKIDVDWAKIQKQWTAFLKAGKTAKGIYFTIIYFYEYCNGDPKKSKNGIGIIPSIYEESRRFWQAKEDREVGICKKIEQQIVQQREQKIVTVKQLLNTNRKPIYTFEMVGDEDDG